jgi:hypothetical protein
MDTDMRFTVADAEEAPGLPLANGRVDTKQPNVQGQQPALSSIQVLSLTTYWQCAVPNFCRAEETSV